MRIHRIHLKDPDVLAGLLVAGIGLLALIAALALPLGTARRPGPGVLPQALGVLLIACGIAIAAYGVILHKPAEDPSATVRMRPLLTLVGAFLLFAALVKTAGLPVAALALIVGASLATPGAKWREVAIFAIGLAAFVTVLFVETLGLPIPVAPWIN